MNVAEPLGRNKTEGHCTNCTWGRHVEMLVVVVVAAAVVAAVAIAVVVSVVAETTACQLDHIE